MMKTQSNNITTSRIIKRIRTQNKNRDSLIYKISFYSMITIAVFIVVTTILQINWFMPDATPMPVITWIIAQPYVGVFFLPFLILSMFITIWISQISKTVSIKNVMNDLLILYECEQITQEDYDYCFALLQKAYQNKIKADEQKIVFKNLEKEKLLQEMEARLNEQKINEIGEINNGTTN